MNLTNLKMEIQQMENQWHKLLFLCGECILDEQLLSLDKNIEVLNLNLLLSEALMDIPKIKYPFYVEEIVRNWFHDKTKTYFLQHIDILFDSVLQTHPIRLLENISKRNRIIVMWPGTYESGILKYAESGHPEYFTCADFEGKVILN
ncbi:BREX-3 system P-loop-containing protein BrxF [Peribacillus frigoritolerans]|uniref:BREX-3 system P-loop-containing protein BrxF n=1 Tax=Peribacillus frigoritolerans TaxID=450367 RepID=UPI003439490F